MRKVRGLPSQMPTIRGKRPSFSTCSTKRAEIDYDFQPGWVAPQPKYFDLEGLACDGYGYTVVISGPAKSRRNPFRRRSRGLRESQASEPALQKPKPVFEEREKSASLDIATVKEVEVRESWHWSRASSPDKFVMFDNRSASSADVELGGSGKAGKSWFRE